MDIIVDDGTTTGADALRSFLRAGDLITDAELSQCWNVAVGACLPWIRDGYDVDAPAGVVEFVLHVAGVVFKHRDSGGEGAILPDGTVTTGAYLTRSKIRSLAGSYGGPYARTPRTVA